MTNAAYQGSLTWEQVILSMGLNQQRHGSRTSHFSVGLRYSGLDQRETFGGTIAGYASGFNYSFDAASRAIGLEAGVHQSWQLNASDSAGWQASLGLDAVAGLAHVQANGNASVAFTGGLNVVLPSNAALQASGVRPYASVQASVRALHEASGLTASLGINYDIRPWGVDFDSDGTNPTTMSLQNMDVWTVFAGLSVRF